MPVREGGTLLLGCVRAYGSLKLRGLAVLSAAQTSPCCEKADVESVVRGGAWDSAFLTHSQEGLTVLGPVEHSWEGSKGRVYFERQGN